MQFNIFSVYALNSKWTCFYIADTVHCTMDTCKCKGSKFDVKYQH